MTEKTRKLALNTLNEIKDEMAAREETRYLMAMIMAINALESQRHGWTPCADGLPKNQGQYQCTIKDSRLATWLKVEPINMLGVRYFYDGRWYNRDDVDPDVIAWQPLPDPYNPDHIRDATKKVDQFREPTKMMQED